MQTTRRTQNKGPNQHDCGHMPSPRSHERATANSEAVDSIAAAHLNEPDGEHVRNPTNPNRTFESAAIFVPRTGRIVATCSREPAVRTIRSFGRPNYPHRPPVRMCTPGLAVFAPISPKTIPADGFENKHPRRFMCGNESGRELPIKHADSITSHKSTASSARSEACVNTR